MKCPKCENDMTIEDCEWGVFCVCEVCDYQEEYDDKKIN